MIDIEKRAVASFQKNLTYFSIHHPALFQKLQILESAIAAGRYRENYALEYLDGYFDVKELASGHFLYGSSSLDHAGNAAVGVNLKKNESVIEALYNFPYTQANIEDLDKLTIINSPMVGTAPIVRFVNEHTTGLREMKKIYKFIFFGVGIGEHLRTVHEKIHAESYLIIEDNLELFRLSMFVTDYQELGTASKLFFSVMDTPGAFKITYNLFAEDMLIRNSHLKFYLLSDSYAAKIKQIQNFAVTQSYLVYPYSYLLHKNLRISRAINRSFNFLNIQKPFDNAPFGDKPVLYLAAGPSLSRHLAWAQANRDRFIIVAVFMICAKLEAAGIIPDIVVHVDEAAQPVQTTLDRLQERTFLDASLFILAASAPLELFEALAPKEHIFLLEDRTRYKKDHGHIEFFSIGEVGYALSLIFGTPELYLLGLDLAVDQATGKTHADGHATSDTVDLGKTGASPEQSGSLRETVLNVKGNRGVPVATTPLFDASIHKVNDFTRQYRRPGQQVFNLGDGAYFDNTQPLEVDVVDTKAYPRLDKALLREQLYRYFSSHASDTLGDEEQNNILVRKKELRKKAKLIERFARQNIKSLDDFRNHFVKLIGELIIPVRPDLIENSDIFWNYFHNVGGYIGNLLNTECLQHDGQTARALQGVLSRQLYKILHAFGQLEFVYLNGNKYFDVDSYADFQNIILNVPFRANHLSQVDALYFVERERRRTESTHQLRFTSNVLGILGVASNLENRDFIQYVNTLLQKVPEARVLLIDISRNNTLTVQEGLFCREVSVAAYSDIADLASRIDLYLSLRIDRADDWICDTLIRHCNTAVIHYNAASKNQTIRDAAQTHIALRHPVITNPKFFGLDPDTTEKSTYKLLYGNYFQIDDDDSLYEFAYFRIALKLLQSQTFREHYVRMTKLLSQALRH